jgi:hypothetical protein
MKQAVAAFLTVVPRGSRVAVVAFAGTVECICPLTEDRARAGAAVDALWYASSTRLFDAVGEAIAMAEGIEGRKAVLVLTDGEDVASLRTLDGVIREARRPKGCPVYTVGLGDQAGEPVLRRLAADTRGDYYPAREVGELRRIFETFGANQGRLYHLAYRTNRTVPDGTLRPIRVSYKAGARGGEAAVYIRGMVAPAAGWPGLFLFLLATLFGLAALPRWLHLPAGTRPGTEQ